MKFSKTLLCFFAFSLVAATSGNAALIAFDHFYYGGDEAVGLSGLGGTENGWAGAWDGRTLQFDPNIAPLNYSEPGYNNAPNPAGSGVVRSSAGNAGHIVTRELAAPLTETAWVSILLDRQSEDSGEGLIWFNSVGQTTGADTYVSIRNNRPEIRFPGNNSTGDTLTGELFLLLARVQINVDGNNDALDFWLNPDLSDGMNSLGSPTLTAGGSDAFGGGLSSIGISAGGSGERMDSLRVGTTLEGVTVIPEPSTYAAIFGLSALGLVILRRRKALRK